MSAYNDMADDTRGGLATILWTLVALIGTFALLATLCGCKTYYENAGIRVRTGNITAPVEISEPTSSANAKFLFFLDGADIYVTKGYGVEIDYSASYAGTWLTSASTQGVHVAVTPVAATNGVNQLSGTANP